MNIEDGDDWQSVTGKIVPGHRVASGLNGNPLFPGGTLRMQAPSFLARGFDLGLYYGGTLNVSIAPSRYEVGAAPLTFRNVKWHPTEPAEDFSFFDVSLARAGHSPLAGKIYYPHPATKPAHFQAPEVLELLLPFVENLRYGDEVILSVPSAQMRFRNGR